MARAEVINRIRSKLMLAMHEEGYEAKQNIRQAISTPYPPASAAGQPPHLRTGELHGSVDYYVTANGVSADLTLRATADHAVYLEFGTQNMAARPFMRPEIARVRNDLPTTFLKHLRSL